MEKTQINDLLLPFVHIRQKAVNVNITENTQN